MNQRFDQPARPRRVLRLSTLLTQLNEEAVADPASTAPTPPDDPTGAAIGSAEASGPPADSATDTAGVTPDASAAANAKRHWRRPRRPRRPHPRSNITVGEILDRTRQASFGFAVALIALISLPFIGLSTPFGLAVAFLAGQMTIGLDRPWLPARARRHQVSMATLDWLGRRIARWTSGLERLIRPRFSFMGEGPFRVLCGVGLILQGLGLALPLPIPGSHWLFIFPIMLYGIALLEADGLLIMLCHAITVLQIALAFWFSHFVSREVQHALRHVGHWVGL